MGSHSRVGTGEATRAEALKQGVSWAGLGKRVCETQGEEGQELWDQSRKRGATAGPRRTLQVVRDESCVLRAMRSPWRVFKSIEIQYNLGFFKGKEKGKKGNTEVSDTRYLAFVFTCSLINFPFLMFASSKISLRWVGCYHPTHTFRHMLISRNALPWNFGAIAVSPKKNYKQNQPQRVSQEHKEGQATITLNTRTVLKERRRDLEAPWFHAAVSFLYWIMVVVLRLGGGGGRRGWSSTDNTEVVFH